MAGVNPLRESMEMKPLNSEILEKYIMHTMLSRPELFAFCTNELKDSDFYTDRYKRMFVATMDVFIDIDRPVSFVDLFGYYIKHHWDLADIIELQNCSMDSFDIVNVIRQLKDITATNELILITKKIENGISKGEDWYELCTMAISDMEMLELEYSKIVTSIKKDLDELVNKLSSEEYVRPSLTIDFKSVQKIVDLSPNNLIFFAASPKAGKTRILSSFVLQMIKNNNIAVQWYSGEDPKEHILRYMLSMETGIPDNALSGKRKNVLSSDELGLIREAQKLFNIFDLQIIDEPTPIETVAVKFSTFCNKRKDKICLLVYDNFNIARDQITGQTDLQKEGYIASMFQKINTVNNRNGKQSLTIVVDHLTKDYLRKQSLEEGYRPRLEHLKGSSRKYEVITQMWFLNKPALYKDLMADEKDKPDIIVNGESIPRSKILKKLIIFELAANRFGSVENDDDVIVRFQADFDTLQIKEWKADVLKGEHTKFKERNITFITAENALSEINTKLMNVGNPKTAAAYLNNRVGERLDDGTIITVDFLFNRYFQYYDALKDYQNGAYTKKGKDLLTFEDFMAKGLYNQKWETVEKTFEKTRDWYLYGLD